MDVVHDDLGRAGCGAQAAASSRSASRRPRPRPARFARCRPTTRRSAPGGPPEPHDLTRPQLGALPQVALVDHRHHRVAPVVGWSARNTTGRPSGGTCTAPSTIPSLGSSSVVASGSGSPSSRRPIRSESGETVYVVGTAGRPRHRRPGPLAAPGTSRNGPAVGGRGVSTAAGACAGLPHRQHGAGHDRRRADPAEGVGGARTEHRLDGDPAGDGDVANAARRRSDPARARHPPAPDGSPELSLAVRRR